MNKVDGRAFLNCYELSYTKNNSNKITAAKLKNYYRFELNELNSKSQTKKTIENTLSAKKGSFKYNIEVEGVKVKEINGEQYIYIGLTGLNLNNTSTCNVGIIKYKLK